MGVVHHIKGNRSPKVQVKSGNKSINKSKLSTCQSRAKTKKREQVSMTCPPFKFNKGTDRPTVILEKGKQNGNSPMGSMYVCNNRGKQLAHRWRLPKKGKKSLTRHAPFVNGEIQISGHRIIPGQNLGKSRHLFITETTLEGGPILFSNGSFPDGGHELDHSFRIGRFQSSLLQRRKMFFRHVDSRSDDWRKGKESFIGRGSTNQETASNGGEAPPWVPPSGRYKRRRHLT